VRRGGELAHVRADLGHDDLGGTPVDAGDGVQQRHLLGVRGDQLLDPRREQSDGLVQVVDVGQELGDQQPVVVGAEPAGQRRPQRRELAPEPALGQRRQHLRVVGAADQGFQHGPAGGPDDVGGHAGQLGSRRPPRTLSSRCTSRQRSWIWVLRYRVSSRSSRIGRGDLEAGPDQPVLDQLGNPGRVGHIRLAARHVPQVGRVQQPALDLILQQLPDRLPVAAGRLHPHPGHPEAGQPLGQHHQPGGGRGEPARLAVAPTMASGTRTQAVTESLCTSSPAQRATNVSTCSPPPPGRRLVAIRRSLSQGNLSLVLVATVRGARGSHVRLISGLSAPRERRRRPDDRHSFIRRGWPAPAMGGLSEIDGRPPCYPAFALVVRLRKSYKDGVNWRSSCCAGPWPRTSRHDPDVESVGASSLSVIPSGVMVNSRTWGWCRLARVFSTVRVRRMAAG
jgi:hypothetical protein